MCNGEAARCCPSRCWVARETVLVLDITGGDRRQDVCIRTYSSWSQFVRAGCLRSPVKGSWMRHLLVLTAGGSLYAAAPAHVPGRLLAGRRSGAAGAIAEQSWRAHGARVLREVPGLRLHVLEVPENSRAAIGESLQKSGLFDYVEPDYYAQTAATPNDPSYISQWHLAKIRGPEAWGVTTGSESVVVADLRQVPLRDVRR